MITESSSWFWWGSVFCGSPSFRRRRVGASISPYKHWLATWLPLSAEFFFLPYLYQESTNKYVFVRCATNNHFVTTYTYLQSLALDGIIPLEVYFSMCRVHFGEWWSAILSEFPGWFWTSSIRPLNVVSRTPDPGWLLTSTSRTSPCWYWGSPGQSVCLLVCLRRLRQRMR